MDNLNATLRASFARVSVEDSNHSEKKMKRNEIVALAERELAAGNPMAAYVLTLDIMLTNAMLEAEAATHRAENAERERNAVIGQRDDYEFILARISEALDGVRHPGSPALQISALREELDAAQSDLAMAGGKLEIVGYTTQADINIIKSSALNPGFIYSVPDCDQPIELLRRVI